MLGFHAVSKHYTVEVDSAAKTMNQRKYENFPFFICTSHLSSATKNLNFVVENKLSILIKSTGYNQCEPDEKLFV